MISKERLTDMFDRMREYSGPGDGPGVYRLAFTDADWQARSYLIGLMREVGLAVREDACGNVVGVRLERQTAGARKTGTWHPSFPRSAGNTGISRHGMFEKLLYNMYKIRKKGR